MYKESQACGRTAIRRGVKANFSTINAEKTGKKIKALRERNDLTVTEKIRDHPGNCGG
jgi:hypothetical protein